MRYCGISEFFHDAGIAFITDQGGVEFATHAERYSKLKLDPYVHDDLWRMIRPDDYTVFYEDLSDQKFRKNLGVTGKNHRNIIPNSFDYDESVNHHVSHAANAYYTRPWQSKEDTVILTMDGQGQLQTVGIYDHNLNLLEKEMTPKSVGLFYNHITRILDLKPMQDEYVVMGLSSYGEPILYDDFMKIFNELEYATYETYGKKIRAAAGRLKHKSKNHRKEDIAASMQKVTETVILEWGKRARKYGSKLCYAGGVAENIVANTKLRDVFDDMWIPSAPGDAGSALGCAAYTYGMNTGKDRINWKDPYLGYDIKREINPKEVVDHLLEHTYCGIANGRAEHGPRALGNRSLIADVRFDVKDTVNEIKRRQKYRPFAPAILADFADQYFEGPMNDYMQYTAKALHDYKSVIHVDGTSRVQLVQKDCKSIIRPILEEYYERTGIPMLLNTSLNIRGMPMVNDEKDAVRWEEEYRVKVF
jgi:carbamoyltransferase